jgi:hypothetical protein
MAEGCWLLVVGWNCETTPRAGLVRAKSISAVVTLRIRTAFLSSQVLAGC